MVGFSKINLNFWKTHPIFVDYKIFMGYSEYCTKLFCTKYVAVNFGGIVKYG